MDSLIIPIKQEYAEEILGDRKTVEFRRRFNPKYRKRAIVFYITDPIKQVHFYAVIKRVFKGSVNDLWTCYRKEGSIKRPTFDEYFQGCSIGYAIVLEQVTELDRPFELEDLKKIGIKSLQSHRSITKEQFTLITGVE